MANVAFPEQRVIKSLLGNEEARSGLHSGLTFFTALKTHAWVQRPSCAHCQWSADGALVRARALSQKADEDAAAVGRAGSPAQLDPGAGLFMLHHSNLDHGDFTPSNLQLLCTPCHQATHQLLPGGDDGAGEYLMLPREYSQAVVINLWRLCTTQIRLNKATARFAEELLQSLRTYGQGGVIEASGTEGASATHSLAASQFAYWAANTKPETYTTFCEGVLDARFLPSDTYFAPYIDFCSEQPLFQAVPQSADDDGAFHLN